MEKKGIFKGYTMTKGVLIGAIAGLVAGFFLGEKDNSLALVGNIFLRLIQLPLVILIMCSIMEAVGSLNPKELGKLGAKTLLLFFFSTVLAGIFGLILGNLFHPGQNLNMSMFAIDANYVAPDNGSVTDQILNYISNNIVSSMANSNNLQCVLGAVLLGVTLSLYGKDNEQNPVLDGVKAINRFVMKYLSIVIQLLPVAVFAFVAQAVGVVGNQLFQAIGLLVVANFAGMVGMSLIFGMITAAYCGVNPVKIIKKMMGTIIVAIISASSAVTLPKKQEECQKNIGVSPKIAQFVCPLGMTLNSDGSVLFYTLSCLTIAQAFGIPYTLGNMVSMVIVSTAFSYAAIMVPGGGLIGLAMILQAVGLPAAGMVIISAGDFILGPLRTINNNIDDNMIAMIVAKGEGEFSKEIYNGTKEFDPSVFSYKENTAA